MITIHKLPNIARSKDIQAIKIGQLVEYNMRKIFLEKSYTKRGGEASPRSFYKKLKLSISQDHLSEMLRSISKWRSIKTLKLRF